MHRGTERIALGSGPGGGATVQLGDLTFMWLGAGLLTGLWKNARNIEFNLIMVTCVSSVTLVEGLPHPCLLHS